MNAHSPPNSIADAIRQVAMIADVNTSAIGMTRVDRTASDKANADHAAKPKAGRVIVNRFAGADDEIRTIMDLQSAALDNLKTHSMLWGTTKRRLLPNANFQRWLTTHTSINDAFEAAVKDLVKKAPVILAEAKKNIGTYNVDLPTVDEIATSFSLNYELEPLPDPKQFNRMFGGEAIMGGAEQALQHQFEQNMQASYNNAVQDTCQRLAKPLKNLAERVETLDRRERDLANGVEPKGKSFFRDAVLENVQEIASVFGSLNVLDDPKLAEIDKKLKALNKITPDILKKRGDIRQAVSIRAKEVLRDLEGILLR